jgi:hypothetical protein
MANPDRPDFGQVIDETWGQIVADTVVRRYATTADRDADLVGFTPAQLAGQTVAIIPTDGSPAWLELHDGTGWRPTPADCYVAGHPTAFALLAGTLACPAPFVIDADPYGMSGVAVGANAGGITLCASGLWLLEMQLNCDNIVPGLSYCGFYLPDHTTPAIIGEYDQSPANAQGGMSLHRIVNYGKGQQLSFGAWSQGGANVAVDVRYSFFTATLLARTG